MQSMCTPHAATNSMDCRPISLLLLLQNSILVKLIISLKYVNKKLKIEIVKAIVGGMKLIIKFIPQYYALQCIILDEWVLIT